MKMKKNYLICLLFLFFSCSDKTNIKTFEFYMIMQKDLLSNSKPTWERMSGKIIIDERKKKVTLSFNGVDSIACFTIKELNNPASIELLNKTTNYDKDANVYTLSIDYMFGIPREYSLNKQCLLYFFTTKTKDDTVILLTNNSIIYFRKNSR